MHGMIRWFAKNDVAANLLMLAIVALGLYSLNSRIPLEVFPSFDINQVSVRVAFPGASPQEIEEGVSIRIEESVQDLSGIRQIVSRSNEGSATIAIEAEDGVDLRELMDDIKVRVDAINTFPDDAEQPIVSVAERRREVISVVVYGDADELTLRRIAEDIRDNLTGISGITQVFLDNPKPYEIAIELSELTLQEYGLTLEHVANVLRQNSLDLSAGNIRTQGGEIFIRSRGQAYLGQEFGSIPVVTSQDGTKLLLRHIAHIRDGFAETPRRTRFNNQNAVEIEVFRVGDQSAIQVAKKVKNYLDEHRASMPDGITIDFWRDRAKIVEARLKTLTRNAWQGMLLVAILLALFLRPAVALWVCVGIPITFMGAFILMPFMGVTLNLMTLFAFILVLGIVVDDAIVTGENVYAHMQRGVDPYEAAVNGTQEVAIPVTFGVLTTIAAFVPLAFLEGRGSWYQSIPYVVVPVLLFSLIESKLILPAHLKHVQRRVGDSRSPLTRFQQKIAGSLETFVKHYYQPFLAQVLHYRYSFLAALIGVVIIVTAMFISGWTKFIWFPRVQSEIATASLTMPVGTAFESTDAMVAHMTEQAQRIQRKYVDSETGESVVRHIFSSTGNGGSHLGRVRMQVVAPEFRTLNVTSQQLVNEWRKQVGKIAGAETLSYRAEIGRRGSPINIEFNGKDVAQLSLAAEKVKERLAEYEAVFDIEDSLSDGKEELQLELKPEARLLGLSLSQLARQVRQAIFGFEVQRIQRGRDEVKVMVRYPLKARNTLGTLDSMLIRTSDGREVPFNEVARVKPGRSPDTIQRVDRKRTVSVSADFDKQRGNMTVVLREMEQHIRDILQEHPSVNFRFEGEARDQREAFQSLVLGGIGLFFVIFILLAIPFKSYTQPWIVISVIPFGAVGAVAGHWIMGMDLTLLSIMGMLALSGVVVNDSLVLVDYVNRKRDAGVRLYDAVMEAGRARFRPVLLTSLTTFAGLIPLLFEKSTQAQFLIPMAVSLGFGILFATVITLLLVPVNYLILEDVKNLVRRFLVWSGWISPLLPEQASITEQSSMPEKPSMSVSPSSLDNSKG